MVIGFDTHNLKAAVQAVMKSAQEKSQEYLPQLGRPDVHLNVASEVEALLMDRAAEAYAQALNEPGDVQVARIEGMVYSPVGFVFERNEGNMRPAPVRRPSDVGDIEYLAYFWTVL
ncbi:hypothetical protein DBB29_24945 [Pandoraea cepalis]|uniref:Uncharacterized protein n=1 Tax=Pandoraea cepalis TaxID=2508294 RepID=A0AAW7MGT0_9BURK|nr:hypothetical protein [Pandoraea cepalis]MDN4571910.1 hypothetical protein [Pandoraea cepalis]MDN4581364.1 hypothetical protein [Pandoraea cepalis]